MAKKSGIFSGRAEVIAAAGATDGRESSFEGDFGMQEQVLSVGSTDWSPEQTEQYIDWRIQVVDAEIAKLRKQLEDLMGARKRWLAVTGGRSKVNGAVVTNGIGNGIGNGHSNGNGATNGHTPVAL